MHTLSIHRRAPELGLHAETRHVEWERRSLSPVCHQRLSQSKQSGPLTYIRASRRRSHVLSGRRRQAGSFFLFDVAQPVAYAEKTTRLQSSFTTRAMDVVGPARSRPASLPPAKLSTRESAPARRLYPFALVFSFLSPLFACCALQLAELAVALTTTPRVKTPEVKYTATLLQMGG